MFLEKAYTIWRMPSSKIGVLWGTWRKSIGGPEERPHYPKAEGVKPTIKRESLETNRQTPGFPPPVKAEEQQVSLKQQEIVNKTTPASPLPISQSQPEVLPLTPRIDDCASEGMIIASLIPEDSSVFSDIDPEERKLLLRIPLELFYPPPPPEHCGDGKFRWKCPIRGCFAILDSASRYTEPFSGFSEVEAEWLRRKHESTGSEMGREIIYHILCQHYESHMEDSGVDIVDVGLVLFFGLSSYADMTLL